MSHMAQRIVVSLKAYEDTKQNRMSSVIIIQRFRLIASQSQTGHVIAHFIFEKLEIMS